LQDCDECTVKNRVRVSVICTFAFAAACTAQTVAEQTVSTQTISTQTVSTQTVIDESSAPLVPRPAGTVLRQIDDPAAHGSWLLVRDPIHLAGPGKWIWEPRAHSAQDSDQDAAAYTRVAIKPVILAGDRLVVEEETPVVDARMAATALSPAQAGAALRVRLDIGGKTMRAIAIGPGRARLAPDLRVALEAAAP
jgi:hypothetical protein